MSLYKFTHIPLLKNNAQLKQNGDQQPKKEKKNHPNLLKKIKIMSRIKKSHLKKKKKSGMRTKETHNKGSKAQKKRTKIKHLLKLH